MRTIYRLVLVIIIIVASLAIIFSCGKDAIKTETTQVNGIKLELLFEKDGCKVYRFTDFGDKIYWSDCRGRTEYSYTTRSGKTTTTHKKQTISD